VSKQYCWRAERDNFVIWSGKQHDVVQWHRLKIGNVSANRHHWSPSATTSSMGTDGNCHSPRCVKFQFLSKAPKAMSTVATPRHSARVQVMRERQSALRSATLPSTNEYRNHASALT